MTFLWVNNYSLFKKTTQLLVKRSLYPEPGSNRHGLLHRCLRPTRLPIPPSGRYGDKVKHLFLTVQIFFHFHPPATEDTEGFIVVGGLLTFAERHVSYGGRALGLSAPTFGGWSHILITERCRGRCRASGFFVDLQWGIDATAAAGACARLPPLTVYDVMTGD